MSKPPAGFLGESAKRCADCQTLGREGGEGDWGRGTRGKKAADSACGTRKGSVGLWWSVCIIPGGSCDGLWAKHCTADPCGGEGWPGMMGKPSLLGPKKILALFLVSNDINMKSHNHLEPKGVMEFKRP